MDNSESAAGSQIPLYGMREGVSVVIAYTLVSPEWFEVLNARRWNLSQTGYPYTSEAAAEAKGRRRSIVLMHRVIMQPGEGLVVDHINQDKLDNRLPNLRITTQGFNCQNTSRVGKYGFRGIYRHKASGLFAARISFERKIIPLGYFKTPEEAATAYNVAALKYYGPDAQLNAV